MVEQFLELFGEYSIGWGCTVIAAIIFLFACYKKIEKYFSEKAIREKEKDEKIQQVINQAKQYPIWHQQSLDIQGNFTRAIDELRKGQQENQRKLEEIEADRKRIERNKLRDRLLQSYRYYTSTEKNPLRAWSEMEADAFWGIFKDYEKAGGNGHVHTEVQPAMRKLEVIPMHEAERIAALMNSRK